MLNKAGGGPVWAAVGGPVGNGWTGGGGFPTLPSGNGGCLDGGSSALGGGLAATVLSWCVVGRGCTAPNLAASAAVRVISDWAHASGNRRHMGAYSAS